MEINATLVKELRDKTGAGMMDCKKALVESAGDMDKAIDYLREKGISKAEKKSGRITAEGLTNIFVNDNKAVILEVNSETDFVAKNEDFKSLIDIIGNTILNSNATSLEEANALEVNESTISELIVSAISTIGENITLRRFELVEKNESEIFGSYLHMGGKISALVVLKGSDEAVAKDIAMQLAAMNPKYIRREDVPVEVLEHEKSILKEQILNEGKPAEMVDKIIVGKVEKYYQDVCIIDQTFVKESSINVSKYLSENNSEVIKMFRYEVGEGIEKRNDNFAEEVMQQLQ